ncbi:hypothetical protein BGZ76_005304, partial [Entomortierella beljakovae]
MIFRRNILQHTQNGFNKYSLNNKENVPQKKEWTFGAPTKPILNEKPRVFIKQPLSIKQAPLATNTQPARNNIGENDGVHEVNLLKVPNTQSQSQPNQPRLPLLPINQRNATTTTATQKDASYHVDKLREYLNRRNDKLKNPTTSSITSTTATSVPSNIRVNTGIKPNPTMTSTTKTLATSAKSLPIRKKPVPKIKIPNVTRIQKVEPNHVHIAAKDRIHPVVTFPTISNVGSTSYRKEDLNLKEAPQSNKVATTVDQKQTQKFEIPISSEGNSHSDVPGTLAKKAETPRKRKREDEVEVSSAYKDDQDEYDLALMTEYSTWKYEERYHPYILSTLMMVLRDYYPNLNHTNYVIRDAEIAVLQVLDFDIGWPGPLSFLRRCSRADNSDLYARTIAKYVLEQVLIDPRLLQYKPSIQAAAAMFIGCRIMNRSKWTEEMVEYSGYTYDELIPVVSDINRCLRNDEVILGT